MTVVAVGSLTVGALAATQSAQADATKTVARWDMDEPNLTTELADSSGNAITGVIGTTVQAGTLFDGATGHKFPWKQPNSLPADPQRLDVIPHQDALNPGTQDFAVTVRLRTKNRFGNIIQKGQGTQVGGYFKMENPAAVLKCLFLGTNDKASLTDYRTRNDEQWHTVKCARSGNQFTMTIDDELVMTKTRAIGSISNPRPISIGGKYTCDVVKITCDYFVGEIDYVQWDIGS